MRDVVIAAAASDLRAVTQDIIRAKSALDESDERVECAEKKLTGLKQERGQRAHELGALLVKAKPLVRQGTWGGYLEKAGLDRQLTFECMSLAGYSPETQPDNNAKATADAASRPVADVQPKARPIVVRLEINGARRAALQRVLDYVKQEAESDPDIEAGILILTRLLKGESL